MRLSKGCIVALTLLCFEVFLSPSVFAGHKYLAANNRQDVILSSTYNKLSQSNNDGRSIAVQDIAENETGSIYDLALSPDGKTFVYSTWRYLDTDPADGVGFLVLSQTDSKRVIWKTVAHHSAAWRVAFSPDGKLLATGSFDEHAKLWEAATGKLLFDLNGHAHSVYDVEFSPDGKTLATCSADGTVRVWNCGTGKIETFYAPVPIDRFRDINQHVYCVAFTPDGSHIISTHYNKTLQLWNLAEKRIDASFDLPEYATKIVMSRDGRRVVCHSYLNDKIFVWNLKTGELDLAWNQKFKNDIEDISTVSRDTANFDFMVLDQYENIFGCDLATGKVKKISSPSK